MYIRRCERVVPRWWRASGHCSSSPSWASSGSTCAKTSKTYRQKYAPKKQSRILAREGTALTRTWTWREPRWWPRASYGRSWGAHRRGSAERDPPPGTDGTTLEINHQNSDQPHREEQRRGGSKTRRRRRRRREAYPVGDHFRELVMPEMGGGRDPKPKRGRWRPTREERGGGGVFMCWGEEP